MNVYLDTSVLLRVLLDQPRKLSSWAQWDQAYSSELLGVECRRIFDRLRLESVFDDEELALTTQRLAQIEKSVRRIRLSRSILHAASQTMPTVVKTLDAFHLVSAVAIRDRRQVELFFATHDSQQATAARALGFTCLES